ncbi:sigma-70 family RNA polymerase sigma factor [Halosquirtibacter xylanolyticus]|uniref:RNA polymerase sigma factor n=1 Tax=Halosquirtibacter xylanolyticus TaxID=3374599 RepID=UPI0037485EB3|nr:sigma-70 family RNA polymerase sigma factor [Prolixibacteraceae bacterium]
MIDERDAWEKLCKGSSQGLETLFKSYYDELANYGHKISSDATLVDDVIQDLFIYLWDKHASLSKVEKVKSYLFIAFKRRLIKALQKQNKNLDGELQEYHGFELSMEDMLMDSELDQIKSQEVRKALMTLGGKPKEAIYLKFHIGLSIAEMADQLEMNPQSVKNLLHRTYKKLRETISKDLIMLFVSRMISKNKAPNASTEE